MYLLTETHVKILNRIISLFIFILLIIYQNQLILQIRQRLLHYVDQFSFNLSLLSCYGDVPFYI